MLNSTMTLNANHPIPVHFAEMMSINLISHVIILTLAMLRCDLRDRKRYLCFEWHFINGVRWNIRVHMGHDLGARSYFTNLIGTL